MYVAIFLESRSLRPTHFFCFTLAKINPITFPHYMYIPYVFPYLHISPEHIVSQICP